MKLSLPLIKKNAEQVMSNYDRLPPKVRKALAQSVRAGSDDWLIYRLALLDHYGIGSQQLMKVLDEYEQPFRKEAVRRHSTLAACADDRTVITGPHGPVRPRLGRPSFRIANSVASCLRPCIRSWHPAPQCCHLAARGRAAARRADRSENDPQAVL
jgi:hypothetical protein